MKMISLGAIAAGATCLIVAMIETLVGSRMLHVEPIKLILLSSSIFTMAVALICYSRVFGSQK